MIFIIPMKNTSPKMHSDSKISKIPKSNYKKKQVDILKKSKIQKSKLQQFRFFLSKTHCEFRKWVGSHKAKLHGPESVLNSQKWKVERQWVS